MLELLSQIPVMMRRILFVVFVFLVVLAIAAVIYAVRKKFRGRTSGPGPAANLQENPLLADFLQKVLSGGVQNYIFEPDGIRYNLSLSVSYDRANTYSGHGGTLISFNALGYQTMSFAVHSQYLKQMEQAVRAAGMRISGCKVDYYVENGPGGVSRMSRFMNGYLISRPKPSPESQSHLKSW